MKSYAEAAGIEAFIASMRGQTNTVDLGHYARTVPNGTARGTLTMSGAASQGAASISVTGVSPSSGTFLAGDMLGLTTTAGAKLLVMVASDCTAAGGSVTVPLANRLRANVASGSSVVWSFPKVPFRIIGTSGVKYVPFVAESVSFDFGEVV